MPTRRSYLTTPIGSSRFARVLLHHRSVINRHHLPREEAAPVQSQKLDRPCNLIRLPRPSHRRLRNDGGFDIFFGVPADISPIDESGSETVHPYAKWAKLRRSFEATPNRRGLGGRVVVIGHSGRATRSVARFTLDPTVRTFMIGNTDWQS